MDMLPGVVRTGDRSMGVVVVIGALVCALSAGACRGSSSGGASCDAPVSTETVTLKDFAFDPACVSATAGSTLTITNTGGAPHSYTVKDTGVNVTLDPGDSGTADLTGIAPGTYAVTCTYHPQMVGALKVGQDAGQ
jgi:plastocyanin